MLWAFDKCGGVYIINFRVIEVKIKTKQKIKKEKKKILSIQIKSMGYCDEINL